VDARSPAARPATGNPFFIFSSLMINHSFHKIIFRLYSNWESFAVEILPDLEQVIANYKIISLVWASIISFLIIEKRSEAPLINLKLVLHKIIRVENIIYLILGIISSVYYYCMKCSNEHKEIACPKCGSKMKNVGY
jgi:hypothetical protein